ncbi:CotS family spore coat protein [Brevibacillus parabrevis]|uniref:CotS family spore coat protein n=1 Tax=Brevibacillus parabrevis TaxID=54914 RepID=UPI0023801D48|nr:CotS family spore coat protein [Brevibacillus parabrevis]WDV93345.1 CotS family spore coat protein [Brevibacillus parabrevis]
MEQYVIKPWDTRDGSEPTPVDWDMQVPPEVDAVAELVIKEYDMTVHNRTLITSKPDKGGAIWRIETNKGPRSLKVLHRTPERSLYSVGLQEYVVRQGARVPALIPARDGKLFVEKGGKLWIVTDWISLEPAAKVDLTGAQELCYGLGEFHRHTKGYVPPAGAKNSSRLYRWPNYYQKIAKKIGWMREMAKAYRETAASGPILAVVDKYEQQAIAALERLKASSYPKMVQMGEPHWGLVHQDYGWSNGQNGPGGLWVIDLDGVAYDLPFRDLRKLITSTMDDMGVWDVTWMRGMIEAYHRANPLDRESFEILLLDMSVPNEFYKHLKEMFYDPVTFLNTEAEGILQRVVATDQTKDQALAELAKDSSQYQPGDYTQVVVPRSPERQSLASTEHQANWQLADQMQLPAQSQVPEQSQVLVPVAEEKAVLAADARRPKAKVENKPDEVKAKKALRIPEPEPIRAATVKKPQEPKEREKARPETRKEPVKQEKERTPVAVQTTTPPSGWFIKAPVVTPVEKAEPAKQQGPRLKAKVAPAKRAKTGDKPVKKKASSQGSKQSATNKKAVAKKAITKLQAKKPLNKSPKTSEKAKAGNQVVAKSGSPRKTQHAAVTHPYKKTAAPSRKSASSQAKKPRSAKAQKTGRNML